MNTKNLQIAIAALGLGVALASAPALAQNGPGALNFGVSSNPQTGGAPAAAQTGSQTTSRTKPLYNSATQRQQPANETQGPAGPGGANFGVSSNPQTGR